MAVYLCVLVGATADARATAARAARAPLTASSARQGITLEKIMSDPDWIGAAVNDAHCSADGRAVYYSANRTRPPPVDPLPAAHPDPTHHPLHPQPHPPP